MIYPEGRNIAVLDDGTIVPVGSRMSASDVANQIRGIVCLPYLGKDPELIGMTLLEAGIYAAAKAAAGGDVDALNKLLDRLMGKPMQTVVSASGTLKDFLNGIADRDAGVDGTTDRDTETDTDPLSE